ncbi:MAG: DUF6538 domain-containing protein [Alphaproteobacteria bacterium]
MTRNNGIYSFRKRVPDDLQGILGVKTIKRSLKTSNPNEAKKRRAAVEAEVMELFSAKRAERDGTEYRTAEPPKSHAITIPSQSNATAKGNGLALQDIFDTWAADKKRSARNKQSAENSVKRKWQHLEAFIALHGNLPIGSIDADHAIWPWASCEELVP